MGRKNLLILVSVLLWAATANATDIGPTIGLNFGADEQNRKSNSLNPAASKASSYE